MIRDLPCHTCLRRADRSRRAGGAPRPGRAGPLLAAGLGYGGSPIPLPVLHCLLAMTDAGLYQVYGATEVSGVATVLDSADHRAPIDDRHLSSAGRPLAGIEVSITATTTGEAAPAGEVGEILLRGEQVMAGYWNQPAGTKPALLPGGWLHTGDAGSSSTGSRT
ncbi:MAG TPA: AMP-binding protein [Pseudonocardia sp.]